MSITNLTRYSFVVGYSNIGNLLDPPKKYVEFVKFEEAMEVIEASSNSLQQLKAKISGLAKEIDELSASGDWMERSTISMRLQQLSAD